MARSIVKFLSCVAAGLAPIVAAAADNAKAGAEKLRDLGFADSSASSVPLGRVLLALMFVAALAVCAAWLLRRYGPGVRFRAAPGAPTPISVIVRNTLPGGVNCQVIQVQGKQVLITATRNGVTSLVLGDAPADAPDETTSMGPPA
jgi:flagellar biogenesis protein FliO